MTPHAAPAAIGAPDPGGAHPPSNLSYLPRAPLSAGEEANAVGSLQHRDYRPVLVFVVVTVAAVLAGIALEAFQEWAAHWGGWSLSQIARRS